MQLFVVLRSASVHVHFYSLVETKLSSLKVFDSGLRRLSKSVSHAVLGDPKLFKCVCWLKIVFFGSRGVCIRPAKDR